MYIYSGDVRLGDCGDPTPYVDMYGKELFVGDIVVTLTEEDGVFKSLGSLSAVVSDKYTSYSDGTHKVKDGDIEYFVMGIKSAWPKCEDGKKKEWAVLKVKDHSDVINLEHWSDFGFNYREN
jgi:hypothetical protein